MSDLDLYKILRVRRNASADKIKAAYRKRAFESHPDRGGDPAEFKAVQLAWEVLSDPERKQRYDETGKTDEAPKDTTLGQSLQMIHAAFLGAVKGAINAGRKLPEVDLLKSIKESIEAQLQEHQRGRQIYEKGKAAMTGLLGRFTAEGENYFESMVKKELGDIEQAASHVEASIVICGKALDVLSRFQYRMDVAEFQKSGTYYSVRLEFLDRAFGK